MARVRVERVMSVPVWGRGGEIPWWASAWFLCRVVAVPLPDDVYPVRGRACVDGVKLPMWILSALLRTFGVECPCCGYWPVAVACARDGAIRFHHFG